MVAAQRFVERGQLDKALAELGKVVQEDPKDTRTWLKMAELHAKRGATAEAAEIYARTGDLYTEQGFTQKAVAVYKNVLKLSPTTVSAHQKLGAIFKQLGLSSDAVQQFELAAVGFQQSGQFAEAVEALRLAAELQPDNVVLRVNLAESASQAGLTDEAVREFGVAADALKAAGRTEEYIRVCERLLFHRPEDVMRTRELAETYISRGSPRLALPKLQTCLRMDVRDPATLSLLARALEQLGQKVKAVSVIKELVRLFAELRREPEREAAILRGLTLDPGDPELQALANQTHLRGAQQPTPSPVWRGTPSPDIGPAASVPIPVGASGRVFSALEGLGEAALATPSAPSAQSTMAGFAAVGTSVGAAGLERGPNGAQALASPSPAISRIMAESEVFVKYELLDRAATNLRRVFQIEPLHREAREKLIEVLVDLGRHGDAAAELVILGQQLSAHHPAEARRLGERALGFAPASPEAEALVRRLGGPLPGRTVSLDDPELEDPRAWKLDEDDDAGADAGAADPNADLLTPPVVEAALIGMDVDLDMHVDMDMDMEVDLDPTAATRSLGIPLADLEAADVAALGSEPEHARLVPSHTTFDVEDETVAARGRMLDLDLDDAESGSGRSDEEGGIAFELDIGTSDLLAVELVEAEAEATPPPVSSDHRKPAAAAAASAPLLPLPGLVAAGYQRELEEPGEPEPPDEDPTASLRRRPPMAALELATSERVEADVETVVERDDAARLGGRRLSPGGRADGRATGSRAASAESAPSTARTPPPLLAGRTPPTASQPWGASSPEVEGVEAERDQVELGAELEQVSFFVDQGLFDDAGVLLDELRQRFGRGRRATVRLAEMQEELAAARHLATGAASGEIVASPAHGISSPTSSASSFPPPGSDAEDDDDVATSVIRTEEPSDPGESYLRLGLFDAAVDEYKKLARDPVREVFALTRMGDCFQAKGTFTEAILRYKRALNCDNVSREEARLLYFQLGMTFERLGDISEALYFFEKVAKRDPGFREVSRKVAELLPRKVKRA